MPKSIHIWPLIISLAVVLGACSSQTPSVTTTPGPTLSLNQFQLAYRLLSAYPDYFWCDPDLYPVGRDEQPQAIDQLVSIRANAAQFTAILEQLKLPVKANYSDAEKLSIYREFKKINRAVSLTPAAGGYDFVLRVSRNEGQTLHGTITRDGAISVLTTETSFNTCPICLSAGTLIDTPRGGLPVEDIQVGQSVWTQDKFGKRVDVPVLATSHTPVPAAFQILHVVLDDGRSVNASPGHPSGDLKALSEYQVGDFLDGARITAIDWSDYTAGATYDLLPAGGTGLYWANGILLKSTLNAGD